MKTKRRFIAWIFVISILFSGCTSGQFSNPTLTPTRTLIFTPTRTSTPSQTPTLTPLPSATATLIPTWITNFAEPILQTLGNRPADFEDDFSQNRGWTYYPFGGSKTLGADLQNGMLFLTVTSTDANKAQGWVEHPNLTDKNFVLAFDFNIVDSNSKDHIIINWFADTSFATLWLYQDNTWSLESNNQEMTGSYNYNSASQNSVVIIGKDDECGIYVNNAAIAHLSGCRPNPSGRAIWICLQAVAGHHTAVMSIDNVKLWNLDKISE